MYEGLIYVDRYYWLAFIVWTFLAREGVVVASSVVGLIIWTFLTWEEVVVDQWASVSGSHRPRTLSPPS
jgi:hypothetical protein